MKALSQLKSFFKLAKERELIGSDQLMYLHLFMQANEEHWPELTRIEDAELLKRMRLVDATGRQASIEVLRRGRQRLKNRGFITFESKGGRAPEYKLVALVTDDTPPDTPADVALVANKRVRDKDVKTTAKSASAYDEQLKLVEGG